MSKKVKLKIAGAEYVINTEEDEAYILALGDELNRRIARLQEGNKYLSQTMVASIAALQYCDEAKKRKLELEDLKVERKAAMESEAKLRIKAEDAIRELERITRENRALREKLDKI